MAISQQNKNITLQESGKRMLHDRETIRVGLTEAHGMAQEASSFPPRGVSYSFLESTRRTPCWVRSPIKGYLQEYESCEVDLIEAILSPIHTRCRWIYSLANFQEAMAFSILGLPTPRKLRLMYMTRLLKEDHFKRLVFWSHAGMETMRTYGGVDDSTILAKSTVVYPGVRRVNDQLIRFNDRATSLLFSGDFFRKGGAHVVDAFEAAQKDFPDIHLRICSDEQIDFGTDDLELRTKYLARIHENKAITLGRIRREQLVSEVLPSTDLFLLPTYAEAFGFAILEAMAYGIPVIATNHFAIPEIIDDDINGILVDTSDFDCERLFRGYRVGRIPTEFHRHMTESVTRHLYRVLDSADIRKRIGLAGLETTRSKFSIERRNLTMAELYENAMT